MLKIWELRKNEEESRRSRGPTLSPAQLRVQTDIDGLELPPTMSVSFPDPNNIMTLKLTFSPESGYYQGGHFIFDFTVSQNYPIDPPKVLLRPRIWHPNIDIDGALCLNILREDWKPVLSLNHIAMGIQFLLLEPNKNDPLNQAAAQSLQDDPHSFLEEVRRAMEGGYVKGIKFDYVL